MGLGYIESITEIEEARKKIPITTDEQVDDYLLIGELLEDISKAKAKGDEVRVGILIDVTRKLLSCYVEDMLDEEAPTLLH